jgi:predicted RNase H-like nuclease
MSDVTVIGVDGARGGWLVAVVGADGMSWEWTRDVAELFARDAAAVGIDIPIGLPDAGRRWCDGAARRQLGRRGVTVFPAPVRPVLGCSTYAEARAVLAARGGASMSAQTFGIVRAVRDLDAAITAADDDRVIEAHPELAFRELTGTPALAGKKTEPGRARRLAALTAVWPDVAALVSQAPRPAAPDDALDALACAWVARRWLRGEAVVLGDGARDAKGLPMRIAY